MGAISTYTVRVNHKSHTQGSKGWGDKFSIHPPPLNKSLHIVQNCDHDLTFNLRGVTSFQPVLPAYELFKVVAVTRPRSTRP